MHKRGGYEALIVHGSRTQLSTEVGRVSVSLWLLWTSVVLWCGQCQLEWGLWCIGTLHERDKSK